LTVPPSLIRAAVIVVWLGAGVSHAQTEEAGETEEIVLAESLLLPEATRGGRVALQRDPVEARLLENPQQTFSAADAIEISPAATQAWEAATADDGASGGPPSTVATPRPMETTTDNRYRELRRRVPAEVRRCPAPPSTVT